MIPKDNLKSDSVQNLVVGSQASEATKISNLKMDNKNIIPGTGAFIIMPN